MQDKLNLLPFSEYIRLFNVKGLLFFVDDIWMDHYKTLEAVTVVIGSEYTSYLPKRIVSKTLEDGVSFFGDRGSFKKFKEDFKVYMDETDKCFLEKIESRELTREDTKKFLDQVSRLFYFYSKTEFFYTDKAYELSLQAGQETLATDLKEWGEMKNEGRSFLNKVFLGNESYLTKLLSKLSSVFKVSVEDLRQYSREEIYKLWDQEKVLNEILTQRNKGFILQGTGNSINSIIGEQALNIIEDFLKTNNASDTKEFRGIVANKGKATGKVKVITADYENFDSLIHLMNDMDQGDILVAETTSPELMPACSKASAILTDQGGLMSHAAIVSREMRIPCIVGFKDLTKKLKDGDMVEVDAEKGIVRILK